MHVDDLELHLVTDDVFLAVTLDASGVREALAHHPVIPTLRMFDPEGGIAALPPRKRITTAFDSWPQRVTTDLPDVYEAVAEYSGEPRRILFWERPRRYRDPPYVLDLRVYRDSIPEQRKDIHDVHAVLVKIQKALERSP